MAGNTQGPWGGGNGSGNKGRGTNGGGNNGGGSNGGNRPPNRPPQNQGPDMDEMLKKGQDRLRVIMGGNGGGNRGGNGRLPTGSGEGGLPRWLIILMIVGLPIGLWCYASFYTVKPEEKSVELFLGKYAETGTSGFNVAPWPLYSYEVVAVTRERTQDIGTGRNTSDAGLMLTGDENVVDIDFQVVWNISDPAMYLFNLAHPEETIAAVSESAMREIIAQSELAPILNRDREIIKDRLEELIQTTLDSYNSGVNIVRVNFDKADPPTQVIDSFRDVQAAEQERDQLQNQADAYANRVLAEARGQAAQLLEEAEGYRAQQVNDAIGQTSRFLAVLEEYNKAPDITAKRLHLEMLQQVLSSGDKLILDPNITGEGGGIVPYLPLNDLRRPVVPQVSETGGAN